jgi:carbon-monoxide dehydrogenase iron sulfur subunit
LCPSLLDVCNAKSVYACPFGAPTFDRTEGAAFMCNLCDGDPLCARWCPFGVLEYIRSDETSIRLKKDFANKLLDFFSLSSEQVVHKEV